MKARRVVNLVRGLPAKEALTVLRFAPQAASDQVYKVLASAVANAENNERLDADSLLVTEAYVDEGPTLKRFRPRAQGRAYRIRKRSCHITITVESVAPAAGPGRVAAKAAPGRKAAKTAPAEVDVVRVEDTEEAPAKSAKAAKSTKSTKATKAPAKKAAAKQESEDADTSDDNGKAEEPAAQSQSAARAAKSSKKAAKAAETEAAEEGTE